MFFTTHRQRGFTILELMVVVTIIGILVAVFVLSQQEARERSRNTAVLSQINEYVKALELYHSDVGAYPSTNSTRVARFCIGDNPPGQCLGTTLTPNATYSHTSAINNALRSYLHTLPRFSQARGIYDYSSPAYSGCTGVGMANTSCSIHDYSFWYVLEGTNQECGRGDTVDAALHGEYTLCRQQGKAVES